MASSSLKRDHDSNRVEMMRCGEGAGIMFP
jgi:hypothetical protein